MCDVELRELKHRGWHRDLTAVIGVLVTVFANLVIVQDVKPIDFKH